MTAGEQLAVRLTAEGWARSIDIVGTPRYGRWRVVFSQRFQRAFKAHFGWSAGREGYYDSISEFADTVREVGA